MSDAADPDFLDQDDSYSSSSSSSSYHASSISLFRPFFIYSSAASSNSPSASEIQWIDPSSQKNGILYYGNFVCLCDLRNLFLARLTE